jgi:hypothetical protein
MRRPTIIIVRRMEVRTSRVGILVHMGKCVYRWRTGQGRQLKDEEKRARRPMAAPGRLD